MKNRIFLLAGLGCSLCVALVVAGVPIPSGLRLLFNGASGDQYAIGNSLVRMTPLLLAALGVTVAWRAGAFNIGGEGQLLMGALMSCFLAENLLRLTWMPAFLATFILIAASGVGGALWAGLAAWLSIKRGVDLVLSTILMNFIAMQLLAFGVEGPLRRAGQAAPMSEPIPVAWMLWRPSRQTDLHVGILIAILLAILGAWYMYRTKAGYLMRATGANPHFVRANHFQPELIKFKSMLLSGGLCGLAGGIQYIGINGQLTSSFSQQYGFLAIPVALVGGLNPLGIIASSAFFGGLFAGTSNLSRFGSGGSYFVYIVQAFAVLALLANRWIEEKREAPAL